jgi:hypothetical protein
VGTGVAMNESDATRFWAKVEVRGPDECWEWRGSLRSAGYGAFSIGKKSLCAHRVAYLLTRGEIPDGKIVCHTCDNRKCCNPAHLYAGTTADNARDRQERGRASTKRARGSKASKAKLTEADVIAIRQRYAAGGITQTMLAGEYGIDTSSISDIVRRESWRHVGQPDG